MVINQIYYISLDISVKSRPSGAPSGSDLNESLKTLLRELLEYVCQVRAFLN